MAGNAQRVSRQKDTSNVVFKGEDILKDRCEEWVCGEVGHNFEKEHGHFRKLVQDGVLGLRWLKDSLKDTYVCLWMKYSVTAMTHGYCLLY